MDYAATGEGRTFELNICFAETQAEAKAKHLKRFYPTDDAARTYYGVAVEVVPFKSKRAKDIITHIFKLGEGLHEDLLKYGIDFYFKYYVNAS